MIIESLLGFSKEEELQVRIIASENASILQFRRLSMRGSIGGVEGVWNDLGLEYEFYNADDPDNKKELDKWRIDMLPVVQIVDGSDVVQFQFEPGMIFSDKIRQKIDQLNQTKNKPPPSKTEWIINWSSDIWNSTSTTSNCTITFEPSCGGSYSTDNSATSDFIATSTSALISNNFYCSCYSY